jgi:hypothetical protein
MRNPAALCYDASCHYWSFVWALMRMSRGVQYCPPREWFASLNVARCHCTSLLAKCWLACMSHCMPCSSRAAYHCVFNGVHLIRLSSIAQCSATECLGTGNLQEGAASECCRALCCAMLCSVYDAMVYANVAGACARTLLNFDHRPCCWLACMCHTVSHVAPLLFGS